MNGLPGRMLAECGSFLRLFFKVRITSAGFSLLLCLVILFILNLSASLFPILCILSYLFFLAAAMAIVFRPHVKTTCTLPGRVTVGREIELCVKVKNLSMKPAFEVYAGIAPLTRQFRVTSYDVLSCLKPHGTAEIHFKLMPLKRGVYHIPPPSCCSLFPFRLFRMGRLRRDHCTVIVEPAFARLTKFDIPMIKSYQGTKTAQGSHTCDSMEYVGNRLFRYGDSLKHIDMKAWARRQKPVVRQFGQEYYSNVGIVLDNYLPKNTKQSDKHFTVCLEAAISLTAAMTYYLCMGEHLITFFSAQGKLMDFKSMRNMTVQDKILETLAVTDQTGDGSFADIPASLAEYSSKLSSVILILTRLDKERIEIIDKMKTSGCNVKVIVVFDEGKRESLPKKLGKLINFIPAGQILDGKLERL
jgi:uncharacterized protein (DUF58 family)